MQLLAYKYSRGAQNTTLRGSSAEDETRLSVCTACGLSVRKLEIHCQRDRLIPRISSLKGSMEGMVLNTSVFT